MTLKPSERTESSHSTDDGPQLPLTQAAFLPYATQ
jgi:hypothetical protein